jgi:uncharacterized protein YigA (DUF484 family)
MSKQSDTAAKAAELNEREVLEYLRAHPQFLAEHPEILEVIVPPDASEGDIIVDFQHYAIRSLQDRVKSVKDHFVDTVESVRDNLSVQSQVHEAVLRIIRARPLDRLLEVLTVDFVQIFHVDVVRLGLESDLADLYESYYPEQHYSGLVFTGTGSIDACFDHHEVLLIPDIDSYGNLLIDGLFDNCRRLAASSVLLKLHLPRLGRQAVLGFGVREKERFHEGQGTELLAFLAHVMAEKLDVCLQDNGVEL